MNSQDWHQWDALTQVEMSSDFSMTQCVQCRIGYSHKFNKGRETAPQTHKYMITTIYQKFISRYGETFTLVEIEEGAGYTMVEILPYQRVARMDADEYDALVNELFNSENEKASWSDGEEEPFDEEDARVGYHQKWDEINSTLDNMGM